MVQDQQWVGGATLDRDVVVGQLERILSSDDFDASPRSRAFFSFIVEETLAGREEDLTQSVIATRVFERRDDFNPTVDPIVRIQAGRLRRSLERYYLMAGAADAVRIELPRGTYVPLTRWTHPSEESAREAPAIARTLDADGWPSVIVGVFDAEGGSRPPKVDPGRDVDRDGRTATSASCCSATRTARRGWLGQGDFALSGHLSSSESGLWSTPGSSTAAPRQVFRDIVRRRIQSAGSTRNRPQDRGTRRVRAGPWRSARRSSGRPARRAQPYGRSCAPISSSIAAPTPRHTKPCGGSCGRAAGVLLARAPARSAARTTRSRSIRTGLDRRGDHVGGERRPPRSLQPASAGGARRAP